jgi:hypothetical protein
VLPEFRLDLWSIIAHRIVHCTQEVCPDFRRLYLMFPFFKSENMLWTKYSWLYFLPFGRISRMISFVSVNNGVIIIFVATSLVSSSERHLIANEQTFWRRNRDIETRIHLPLQFHRSDSSPNLAESSTSLFMFWLRSLFEPNSASEALIAARIFSSPTLSVGFLWP